MVGNWFEVTVRRTLIKSCLLCDSTMCCLGQSKANFSSGLKCVSIMDSNTPLYSPVHGSGPKFSSSPSINSAPPLALGSVLHAKVQRFRKGDLVDSKWEDSPILVYSLLCSIVCSPSVLAVRRSLLRTTFCFHLVANATEVRGGSQPPRPVLIASAVRLDLAASLVVNCLACKCLAVAGQPLSPLLFA